MGFLEDRREKKRKAAEQERRQAEEDARLVREFEERSRQNRKELWGLLGSAVTDGLKAWSEKAVSEYNAVQQHEAEIKAILADPSKLDALSDVQLEHLKIRTEAEVGPNIDHEESTSLTRIGEEPPTLNMVEIAMEKFFFDRKLLLRLIDANQARRTQPKLSLPPSAAERRQKLSSEIQDLISERNETIKNLDERGASEEEVKQVENMYSDGIRAKQMKLRALLSE